MSYNRGILLDTLRKQAKEVWSFKVIGRNDQKKEKQSVAV